MHENQILLADKINDSVEGLQSQTLKDNTICLYDEILCFQIHTDGTIFLSFNESSGALFCRRFLEVFEIETGLKPLIGSDFRIEDGEINFLYPIFKISVGRN